MPLFQHLLKTARPLLLLLLLLLALGASGVSAQPSTTSNVQDPSLQAALGTAFTFHGQLIKNGSLFSGACDFSFSLWDAASAGTQIGSTQAVSSVNVSSGVFAVVLNEAGQFGPSAFDGSARWLGMQVKCAGDLAASDLGRQALLAAPYALYATRAGQADTALQASGIAPTAGTSVVAALNNPATSGQIDASRLSSNVLLLNPAAPQFSPGDANGTAAMISLQGQSTCCGANSGLANFKVYQNGSFLATGNLGIGTSPMEGKGYRTSWYTYKGAFRSGYADNEWDDTNTGFFSWAGGSNSTASGLYSFSFGDTNFASSTSSIAFGSGNEVKGAAGFSAGAGNRICDTYGVAFGNKAQSGGPLINGKCDPDTFNIKGLAAVAIGYNVTADADHTTTLGKFASNNGFSGTFVWSDGSATASADTFKATANNEFAARATGGFRFRTNLTGTTGCNLPAGSGVFNCTSDRNQKEQFSPVDGETVLQSIAGMPIQSWNYREDPLKTRHLGPTAQDFFAAFGLGESDKTIGMLDIDGVNMLAIQALEKRTRELQSLEGKVAQLEADKLASQAKLDSLETRLAALENAREGGTAPQTNLDWLWTLGGGLVLIGVAGSAWLLRQQAHAKEVL